MRGQDNANIYANDPLMRTVQLGLETYNFIMNNRVGKHLVECAKQYRDEALGALANADPNSPTDIMQLQWQAKVPELFLCWLDEAIANGQTAEETIEIEDGYNR